MPKGVFEDLELGAGGALSVLDLGGIVGIESAKVAGCGVDAWDVEIGGGNKALDTSLERVYVDCVVSGSRLWEVWVMGLVDGVGIVVGRIHGGGGCQQELGRGGGEGGGRGSRDEEA